MSSKLVLFGDFETTGLDTTKDVILEAYFDLRLVEHDRQKTAPLFSQHAYLDSEFDRSTMHPGAFAMHERNGLWADLELHADSKVKVAVLDSVVSRALVHAKYTHPDLSVHLGGMGVANYDKRLIERDMPLVHKLLHYRCDDVSIVEMFVKDSGWCPPEDVEAFSTVAHRAKEDVEQGIAKYEYFHGAFGRTLAAAA